MRNFILALRSLLKKGQGNIVKILSLGVGLAVGLIIIAELYFEFNYDNFYPDSERIYQIRTNFKMGDDEAEPDDRTSGGVALGMRNEIPGVESATRATFFSDVFYTEDKQKFSENAYLADEMFFDVLPRPMVLGNAKEILSKPMYAIISRSVAEKLAENISGVIGQTIEFEGYPDKNVIIGGIFEDLPKNSHLQYDILISLNSIINFWQWDGSLNWDGNERYYGYVKLADGINPDNLATPILEMQKRHQDLEEYEKEGYEISYFLVPLSKAHTEVPGLLMIVAFIALLAFVIILIAVTNYILIVISSLVNRTKEIGVYRCYGASNKNITGIILSETLVHLFLSLIVAAVFILILKPTIENIFGNPIEALFTFNSALLLTVVCGFVFLFTGLIPARIFVRIPVSAAFRNFKGNRRRWKHILLFFQFTIVSFLITLLIIMGLQYRLMINDNPGYEYENVLYHYTYGLTATEHQKAMDELKKSPQVELVTEGTFFLYGPSGNNVYVPDDERAQFNFGDLYSVDENYLDLFEIPVVEGKNFDINSTPNQMIVSRSFAEKLSGLQNWKDGVVGKNVLVTEHDGIHTIIGVHENIRIGSVQDSDPRPTAMFYKNKNFHPGIIFIKLSQLNQETILQVIDILESANPGKDVTVTPYKATMISMYDSFKDMRNIIMVIGIITLIIAITGLAGYTRDEVNRRSAEIAIRKINGATILNIQKLFIINILWVSIPSVAIGSTLSLFVAAKWMESFTKTIDFSIWLFLLCSIIVLSIIVIIMLIGTYRIAVKNPVESIKNE
ncbi:MAG: ABC transporter permease [Bacteroidales bacterium]|jgi:putative ABC transport system permease protein|nr:ABC transporter permease [Bacteroidales bacterium]